ncbi:MAG: hypothetical protein IJ125_05460 [Atopobiaceae bacterium]|nr:hypothetical protein [Atopobiaceae bacterium]
MQPLTAVSIIAVIAVVVASWTVYEGHAEHRLRTQTELYADEFGSLSEAEISHELKACNLADTRITLIGADGTVLFDSELDNLSLKNHADREEIVAARKHRSAVTMRRSETTGTDTLYAACVLDTSDTILRLSETRVSFPSYVGSLLVPLIIIAALATLFSLLLSRIMTQRISEPLVSIDLEHPLQSDAYIEIEPLLERLDVQRNELINQNDQLKEAMVLRREFTGNVSHEMKSPLQVIGGYAELIENGSTSQEDTKRFAGLIRTESQSMRRLIDDVLTLSRLDEPVDTNPITFDLSRVCERASLRLKTATESRGISVDLRLIMPALIQGQERLAEQMVYNLIDNAIRHGKGGGHIQVELALEGDQLMLSVADDGPGIPKEAYERIFERFYRIDSSRSRQTGGTGLGLAIVKHAAESMGGNVCVQASEEGGCLFVVRLPSARTARQGRTK